MDVFFLSFMNLVESKCRMMIKLMIPLFLVFFVLGCGGESTSKDYDISKLMGVDEATVADYFNVSVNDLGIYPNDKALSVMCSDGYCNWVNLSSGLDNYEKYNFAGVKVGDDKETTKTMLESNGFEFLEEHEASDGINAIFTDKNRYTLTVQYQDGKAKNILYMNEPIDEMMEPIIDESDYQELVDALEETNVEVDATEEGSNSTDVDVDTEIYYGTYGMYLPDDEYCEAYIDVTEANEEYIYISYYGGGGHEVAYFQGPIQGYDGVSFIAYADEYNEYSDAYVVIKADGDAINIEYYSNSSPYDFTGRYDQL